MGSLAHRIVTRTAALGVLSLLSSVVAACKAPVEAKAGSCGSGSSAQSVVPHDDRLKSFLERAPAELKRATGAGGCLTFRKPGSVVQRVCEFDQLQRPPEQRVPLCAVHFRPVAGPGDKIQKLMAWTSRNCLDYVSGPSDFFVEFFSDGKPMRAQLPRLRWPAEVRTRLATQDRLSVEAQEKVYGAVSAFADVHNFDRFVIEVSLSDALNERLRGIFQAQKTFAADLQAAGQVENLERIRKWQLLTEKQALLRSIQVVASARTAGCTEACQKRIEGDAREEFVSGLSLLSGEAASKAFDEVWQSPEVWSNAAAVLSKVSAERQSLFETLFRELQGLAVSAPVNAVPVNAAPVAGGTVSSGFRGGRVEDVALMHGHRWSAPSDASRASEASYQGLPMSYLFNLGTTLVPNSGARGFVFGQPLGFGPLDEGHMVSLFGLAPVAFVSSPQVRLGKYTGAAVAPAAKKRTGIYAATGCD